MSIIKNNKETKKVSVILTIYGLDYSNKIESVLKSIKEQTINTEIIIVEQGLCVNKLVRDFCIKHDIKYILTLPDIEDGNTRYNIGRVRNIGACLSSGEYLYFTDIDILIHNKNYLENLLNYCLKNDIALFRPKMRRLTKETSNSFTKDYLNNKSIDFREKENICLVDYDKNSNSIEVINDKENYCIINNLPHVIAKNIFKKGVSYEFNSSKIEDFHWQTTFHCGGIFCSFEQFLKVGGFCENYHNWGLEDIDFQRKLNETIGLQLIDNIIPENSILHFEHLGRYDNKIYLINRVIFENRMKQGITQLCEQDISNTDTFIGGFIQGNIDYLKSFFSKNYILENELRKI